MDIFYAMLIFEIALAMLLLGLFLDSRSRYDEMCVMVFILSVVFFMISAVCMHMITDVGSYVILNSTSGNYTPILVENYIFSYYPLSTISWALAFLSLLFVFLKSISIYTE